MTKAYQRVRTLASDGAALSVTDFDGDGSSVLLLHGLAGYAGEWLPVVEALPEHRCFALDLRGHGRSERRPQNVSADAHVGDVTRVVDELGTGRVHLVGQSFGGHIAFLVAAWHPTLVGALVIIEASPSRPSRKSFDNLQRWLEAWPRPFRSRAQALSFFGGGRAAETWCSGLVERAGELWPRFDAYIASACAESIRRRDWWEEWGAVQCPTLLVRGEKGDLSDKDVERMATTGPQASVVLIPAASHNAHMDNPAAVADVLRRFLAGAEPGDVESSGSSR
jgi:pimeloyl-ACP methyl ester carboxylesterase